MARLAGIELPRDKRIDVALSYIYGIGPSLARGVLETTQVRGERRVKDLSEEELHRLQTAVAKFRVEGDLRREVTSNIKRLVDIQSYRGTRHQKNLPVRGQRTRTNARTRKGPRKTVGIMRAKTARGGAPGGPGGAPGAKGGK